MNVDICINDSYVPALSANGDFSLIADNDCLFQELCVEAVSVEGDLWYDLEWGWSLIDFLNAQQDELTLLEIEQRCRQKLKSYDEIAVESILVSVEWSAESTDVSIAFRFIDETEQRNLNIQIGKTEIEVIDIAQ